MVKIKRIPVGQLSVNCYIVENNDYCIIIDPGSETDKIINYIEQKNLNVEAILLTHGHFDHFSEAELISRKYNISIYVHKDDYELLYDEKLNISYYVPGLENIKLSKDIKVEIIDEKLEFKTCSFDVFHVPGHSPGSVCFYNKDLGVCFTGDAIFQLSIGRTDFTYCNENLLKQGIRSKLLTLPNKTILYPGHGIRTSVEYEKKNNPYI